MSDGIVTAADIAADRDWSLVHAWRWLKKKQARYGATVVQRETGGRRRLYLTTAALARILAEEKSGIDPAVARELTELREAVADQGRRLDAVSRELSDFRRLSNEWFRGARTGSKA